MRPPESSWPPPWKPGDPPYSGPTVPGRGPGGFPPPGWPSKEQIDYAQAGILLLLLVLALPWVVSTLITDPGGLVTGIARRRLPI